VQYFLAANCKSKLPLLMWPGRGLNARTYEAEPDGGKGWLTMFIREGGMSTAPTRLNAVDPARPREASARRGSREAVPKPAPGAH
jgi:hypothetical protein